MTPILDWFRFNFIFSATCLHMARTFVFCVVSSKIFGCFILLGYLFAYFVHCRLLLKFGGGSKSKESFIWNFWLILRSGHQRMSYFACSRRLSYQFSCKIFIKTPHSTVVSKNPLKIHSCKTMERWPPPNCQKTPHFHKPINFTALKK